MLFTDLREANARPRITGLRAGDIVTISFAHPDMEALVLSVSRNNSRLIFARERDDKTFVYGYAVNLDGARLLLCFICEISGLDADESTLGFGRANFTLRSAEMETA